MKRFEEWRNKIRWKSWEEDIINDNWPQKSDRQIQKLIPNRTLKSIIRKRRELGLKKEMQKHQIWTPEETKTLLNVWKDYNQREISEQFIPSKTPVQINQKKMQMGLKKPPVWSDEERGLLLEYGEKYSSIELKKLFFHNKTSNQIAWMRKHFGIKRNLPQSWAEEDLDILKKYGSIWPDEDIQYELLPHKSLMQIQRKRRDLNIKKNYRKQPIKK